MNKKVKSEPLQEVEVIELRQKSVKSKSNSNADYRVYLDDSIVISEGDIVNIKSSFIDSVAFNSDKVMVVADKDIDDPDATKNEKTYKTLTTYHNFYVRDWGSSISLPSTQREYETALTTPDGRDYIMTSVAGQPADETWFTNRIRFDYDVGNKKLTDPCVIALQYTDLADVVKYVKVEVSQSEINKQRHGQYSQFTYFWLDTNVKTKSGSISFPIICQEGTLEISQHDPAKHDDKYSTQLHQGGLSRSSNTDDDYDVDNTAVHLVPSTFKQDFLLQAGNYNKTELARQLSHLFSKMYNDAGVDQGKLDPTTWDCFADTDPLAAPPNDIIGNTFFMTSESLRLLRGDGTEKGTAGNTAGKPFFVRVDSNNAFRYLKPDSTSTPPVHSYWCGSTAGIGIEYSEEVDKFEIVQLHTSIMDRNGTNISHTISHGGDHIINNKIGGVYLTNLEPDNFWFRDLNFDRDIMVHEGHKILGVFGAHPVWTDAVVRVVPYIDNFEDGINTTGDMIVLNNFQIKVNQGTAFNPANADLPADLNDRKAFDIAVNPTTFDIGVQQTTSIYADTNTGQENADNHEDKAFFKVEVDMGVISKISGGENNNRIKSIISRFYSIDSYTSSYNEGDITYQHKGAPINIKDIGIRILKPNGEPSEDIGNCNSIFLEIIRQK